MNYGMGTLVGISIKLQTLGFIEGGELLDRFTFDGVEGLEVWIEGGVGLVTVIGNGNGNERGFVACGWGWGGVGPCRVDEECTGTGGHGGAWGSIGQLRFLKDVE